MLDFQVILNSFQPHRSPIVAGNPGWLERPFLGVPFQHPVMAATGEISQDKIKLRKIVVDGYVVW